MKKAHAPCTSNLLATFIELIDPLIATSITASSKRIDKHGNGDISPIATTYDLNINIAIRLIYWSTTIKLSKSNIFGWHSLMLIFSNCISSEFLFPHSAPRLIFLFLIPYSWMLIKQGPYWTPQSSSKENIRATTLFSHKRISVWKFVRW